LRERGFGSESNYGYEESFGASLIAANAEWWWSDAIVALEGKGGTEDKGKWKDMGTATMEVYGRGRFRCQFLYTLLSD
jgi:hypothetical protein